MVEKQEGQGMSDNNPSINTHASLPKQIESWVFRIVIGVSVIWLLLIFLEVSSIQWAYETISDWLSQNLNLDDEISFGLAVILTAAALPFFSLITSFIFLGKYQVKVALLAIGAACLAIVLQLAFGQDVFFLEDGTPMRCYAMTPDGIKVARRKPSADCPRDKTYQIQYLPMTRQITSSVLAAKRGVAPVRIDIKTFDGNYIDGASGRSLVWYYRNEDGAFELFYGAGFDPATGQPLLPADSIVKKAVKKMKAAEVAQYTDHNGKASVLVDRGEPQSKMKGRWMKFDSEIYTLANGDPESIIVDNPEVWTPLPKFPTGYRFNVYCGEGVMKVFWKGGPQYGKKFKCGEKIGDNLENLFIAVAPNTKDSEIISVWMEPNF